MVFFISLPSTSKHHCELGAIHSLRGQDEEGGVKKSSNFDAKDSICNRAAGLQAMFASAAVLLHSEHSL